MPIAKAETGTMCSTRRGPIAVFLFVCKLTYLFILQLPSCDGLVTRGVSNCTGNVSAESVAYSECVNEPPAYEDCPDASLCESSGGDNVGLAFGLTLGAGLATTVGALIPFVPLIKRSSTNYLAAGLAVAAGVMLYVSFTEIFDKSKYNFCCETQDHYVMAATVCFFGGILFALLLDLVVWSLEKLDCGCTCSCGGRGWMIRKGRKMEKSITLSAGNIVSFSKHGDSGRVVDRIEKVDSNALIIPSCSSTPTTDSLQERTETIPETEEEDEEDLKKETGSVHPNNDIGASSSEMESHCQTSISDGISISIVSTTMSEGTNNVRSVSVNELFSSSSLQRMNAVVAETASSSLAAVSASHMSITLPAKGQGVGECGSEGGNKGDVVELPKNGLLRRNSYMEMVELVQLEPQGPREFKEATEILVHDTKKLKRMGLLTGLAIGLHNFPEGLATFVATLSNPSLGIALAIAIALHNIPEGVCVSMPVYYATGSKWKAFMWAFLSGVSEPIGALMGWLVLKELLGPLVYGIFFGVIAGMMVLISLKELLPTAFKFDKSNGIVIPVFLIVGMVIMAASLLLFLY